MKKGYIFSFILGAFIFGISSFVFAVYLYSASDISFSSEYTEASNAQEALEELYAQNQVMKSGDATSDFILSGKSAVVNGEVLTGSMPNIGTFNKTISNGDTLSLSKGYYDGGTINVNPSKTIMAVGAYNTCATAGSSRLLFTNYDFVSPLITYSSGVFTVKVAGSYTIKAAVMTHLTREAVTRVWISINGTDVTAVTGDDLRASSMYTGNLKVGDQIRIYAAGGNNNCCNMPTASIYLN